MVLVASVTGLPAVLAQGVTSLTLKTLCGSPGASLAMTGDHFAPGRIGYVVVTFDPGGSPEGKVTVPAASIDVSGHFDATLTVPSRPNRATAYAVVANQITQNGSTETSATAFFLIPCPTLILKPDCGSVGDPIEVVGAGFRQDVAVGIAFTPSTGGTPDAIAVPGADSTFNVIVRVPQRPPGDYSIVATQTYANFARAIPALVVTAAFKIPCVNAVIVLRPTVGPRGTVTTVVGTGFPPNAVVKLTWSHGIAISRPSIHIDATQGFTITILIFPHDELGPRRLSAGPDLSVSTAPLFNIASADFLVVQGTEQPHDFSWRH